LIVPFHSIVLFQATRPIEMKQTLYKKTENQYKAQKKQKHIYTTKSALTYYRIIRLLIISHLSAMVSSPVQQYIK